MTTSRRSRSPPDLGPPPRLSLAVTLDVGGEALAVLRLGDDDPTFAGDDALTAAEREVARLARDGLSNARIAQRRRTSPHTVATQLARAYAKLGVGSRAGLLALPRVRGA